MTQDQPDDGSNAPSPEDIRENARSLFPTDGTLEAAGDAESAFTILLGTKARVSILDALVAAGGNPLTASRICEMSGISTSSFGRGKEILLQSGLMEKADKVGNAQRYALATDHPGAQLLKMFDNVLRWGQTPDLLNERFVGTPGSDYEPGDHPNDLR